MVNFEDNIISDPQICNGKPILKGRRIPVHIILGLLAAGETFDGVRRAYPNVDNEDILACLQYASALSEEEAGVA